MPLSWLFSFSASLQHALLSFSGNFILLDLCSLHGVVHGPRSTVHFLCKKLCFFFVAMLPLTYLSFVRYAGFVFAFRRFCCGRLQFLLLPLYISFPTPAAALLSPARALGHYTELSARFYNDFFSTFFYYFNFFTYFWLVPLTVTVIVVVVLRSQNAPTHNKNVRFAIGNCIGTKGK